MPKRTSPPLVAVADDPKIMLPWLCQSISVYIILYPIGQLFFFVFSLFKFVSAINSNGAYSERIPIMFLSSFSQDIWSLYWEGIKTSSFLWKNFFVVMPDWYDYDAEDEDCPEVINAISVADLDKFCPDSRIRIPNIKMFFILNFFFFFFF